eukprot:452221-Pelagomonas_calceolata.AAC.5
MAHPADAAPLRAHIHTRCLHCSTDQMEHVCKLMQLKLFKFLFQLQVPSTVQCASFEVLQRYPAKPRNVTSSALTNSNVAFPDDLCSVDLLIAVLIAVVHIQHPPLPIHLCSCQMETSAYTRGVTLCCRLDLVNTLQSKQTKYSANVEQHSPTSLAMHLYQVLSSGQNRCTCVYVEKSGGRAFQSSWSHHTIKHSAKASQANTAD